MIIKYINDTKQMVRVHPMTFEYGCEGESHSIEPLEERNFVLPEGTIPSFTMCDYGNGLSILIKPVKNC